MNGNRSKYTYTPTYGMQKRGMIKKPSSVRPVPETPDFTQIPDPVVGVPLQQSTQGQSMQQGAAFSAFSQPNTPVQAAPVQPYPVQQGYSSEFTQTTFVMPNFVQPAQSAPLPPMQSLLQQNTAGSAMPGMADQTAFSARNQGFVPPSNPTPPFAAPQAPAQWQPMQQPVKQSIPPFAGASAPYQAAPFQPAAMQPNPYAPFQPVPQQNGFTVQPAEGTAPPRTASTDLDKILSIFIFCVLPLLFLPCLFVSSAWDFLRYLFIGSAIVGLGAMWYRQLYTPVTRLVSSIVYVALCVVAIAMLMQDGNAKQTSANMSNPSPAQVTPSETPTQQDNAVIPVETPQPTLSGPSEAERRLSLFMELWQVNNTTEMVNLVQPSWRSQQENASTSLFFTLANRTPEDFTIEDISGTETDNSRTVTMRATINKNTGKTPQVYRFMVMMVKEGGEWYVNPNSLATNDVEETKQADENVVKTQSSGVVTEPPRETVTPAPPASTMLYYNIGGNFYHMDPECPSVGRDYLPFDASFPYSDLRSYNRDLLPCLNCNAPIDPLD